jgi:Fic family protein
LWQALIRRPMLYISAYFEARRDAYYDGLLTVSRENDWAGWCRFLLEAIRAQAEDNLARARAILELYEKMKCRLPEMTRSQYAIRALDWVFERPVFRSSDFIASSGIPAPTARRFVLTRLHQLLATVAGQTSDDQRRNELRQHAILVAETAERSVPSGHDRATIQAAQAGYAERME